MSMGLTPLQGLMMGTPSGSIDPGILWHMQARARSTLDQVDDAITHRAGLLGVSGISGSVRELEEASEAGHARARLALDMFADRAAAGIAAAATRLGRLDALVFTRRIGEHSYRLRDAICGGLGTLGVPIPSRPSDDADCVPSTGSAVAVLRVTAREDLVMSRDVAQTIGASASSSGST
jgi:acetate kinase